MHIEMAACGFKTRGTINSRSGISPAIWMPTALPVWVLPLTSQRIATSNHSAASARKIPLTRT